MEGEDPQSLALVSGVGSGRCPNLRPEARFVRRQDATSVLQLSMTRQVRWASCSPVEFEVKEVATCDQGTEALGARLID